WHARCHRPVDLLVKRRWNLREVSHWTIDMVYTFLEHVANQQIDDVHSLLGILPQETGKAETFVVERVDQLAHRFDPAIEFRLVLPETFGREIVVLERVVNR